MKIHEGKLQAKGLKIGIVVSRFNSFLTDKLLDGALDALRKLGAEEADITVCKVPGSFEAPLVVKKLAASGRVDGLVCLGALIRGETPHFDFLAAEVTKSLSQISLETGVPVTMGVLTVDSIEQGIERSGTKAGNKGWDAVGSLVELLTLIKAAKL
ncbi:MAG: 6,7-dimethyl-8-ribityllumazine synthase [Acidobacteriota bacterium]|jgi:6,7-dimethyl-8-ribityllumazine synthase|nr:6,7-dimethyl-8-ribityllumazine synthase [Acidobacteriota bacterium]OQB51038.1 MAG: 6,7-dimethyl-8-ribityllumazine synthase [Candidatus Aminicenantes bacterium ADurb.Bin147]HNQ80496.1 6,7-dimethyl-8-ribityllumazine synthase [Candidatus Aminicenantes bacterium]MDD8028658.1 6,7-dimethyl-8-ribityllumazine synthase [Acidobacteriota bacterium]MDD8033172.1 6,7-dimethyl-8-ribityllumazine synthase [Acidobacteriota bacterium]